MKTKTLPVIFFLFQNFVCVCVCVFRGKHAGCTFTHVDALFSQRSAGDSWLFNVPARIEFFTGVFTESRPCVPQMPDVLPPTAFWGRHWTGAAFALGMLDTDLNHQCDANPSAMVKESGIRIYVTCDSDEVIRSLCGMADTDGGVLCTCTVPQRCLADQSGVCGTRAGSGT